MKNKLLTIVIPLIILLLFGSLYTVHETEQVVVVQFGKPVGDIITEAGLKFKIPLIQNRMEQTFPLSVFLKSRPV